MKSVFENYNADLVYLPTFRRIENNFKVLKFNTNIDLGFHLPNLTGLTSPLINLGMEDVKKGFKRYTEEMKEYFFLFLIEKDKDKERSSSFEGVFYEMRDKVEKFKSVCNKYLINKKVCYDNFEIMVISDNNEKINLEALSSGEKQILSIFYKIYLRNKKVVLLIDEPEISLSIEWQETFIKDIQNSKNCLCSIVMTHSPFIFSTPDLRANTVDLSMFIRG